MIREEAINVINNADLSKVEDRVIKAIFYLCTNKALEQEPCEDAISRQAVLDIINFEDEWLHDANSHNADTKIAFSGLKSRVKELPPVTPQPKIGHWIESTGYDDRDHFYSCSECGRNINLICGATLADYPYCHCGAKMEVEE